MPARSGAASTVAAALNEARNPNNIPAGELRKIENFDALGRVEQVDVIDQESFVKPMAEAVGEAADVRKTGVWI